MAATTAAVGTALVTGYGFANDFANTPTGQNFAAMGKNAILQAEMARLRAETESLRKRVAETNVEEFKVRADELKKRMKEQAKKPVQTGGAVGTRRTAPPSAEEVARLQDRLMRLKGLVTKSSALISADYGPKVDELISSAGELSSQPDGDLYSLYGTFIKALTDYTARPGLGSRAVDTAWATLTTRRRSSGAPTSPAQSVGTDPGLPQSPAPQEPVPAPPASQEPVPALAPPAPQSPEASAPPAPPAPQESSLLATLTSDLSTATGGTGDADIDALIAEVDELIKTVTIPTVRASYETLKSIEARFEDLVEKRKFENTPEGIKIRWIDTMKRDLPALGEEIATLWDTMSGTLGRVPAPLVRHLFETWYALRTLEAEFDENRLSVESGTERLDVVREELAKIKAEYEGLGLGTAPAPTAAPEAISPETATTRIPGPPPLTPLMKSQEETKAALRLALEAPSTRAELAPMLSRLLSEADTADEAKLDLMKTYARAAVENDEARIQSTGSLLAPQASASQPPEASLVTPPTPGPAPVSTIHPRLLVESRQALIAGERSAAQLNEATRSLSTDLAGGPSLGNFAGGCALQDQVTAAISTQETLVARVVAAVNTLKRVFASYQRETAGMTFVSDAEFREAPPTRTTPLTVQAGGGETLIQLKKRLDSLLGEIRAGIRDVPALVAATASLRERLQTLRQQPRLETPEPCSVPVSASAPASAPSASVPAPVAAPPPIVQSTETLPVAAVPLEVPEGETFQIENPLNAFRRPRPQSPGASALPPPVPPPVPPVPATAPVPPPVPGGTGLESRLAAARTAAETQMATPTEPATGTLSRLISEAQSPEAPVPPAPVPQPPVPAPAPPAPVPQPSAPVPAPRPRTQALFALGKNGDTLRLGDEVVCDLYNKRFPQRGTISRFIKKREDGADVLYVEALTDTGSWNQPANACTRVTTSSVGTPIPGARGPLGAVGTPGLPEALGQLRTPLPAIGSRAGTVRRSKGGSRKKRLTSRRGNKTNVRGSRRR